VTGSQSRRAAVVGVAESDLGVVGPDRTGLQLQAQAAQRALCEAGLGLRDVDGIFTAGGESSMPSCALAEYLGISPRWSDTTSIGGASFESHVGHATVAIARGECEVALISYGSVQRSSGGRTLGRLGAVHGPAQFESIWGLPLPVGAYALAAMRHMHLYGTTSEQLAQVAVAARQWAHLNEKAYRRDLLTTADVLASPMVSTPLHRLDCCLVTDGGGAVVVTNEAVARQTNRRPVWIAGHAEAHTHHTISNMPDLTVTPAALSGPRAMAMAGVTHADIDIVEIYDSFTITVLLTLEGLGFCQPGEAGDFVTRRGIGPGGDFPLNTNGGGLSYCHPGMYGIFLLIEATRQLRGECGVRQVEGARLALVHGTGGVLSSGATVVLSSD